MASSKILNGIRIIEANRFSVFVDPKDVQGLLDLGHWVTGFAVQGIPAVVAKTSSGYAVYRLGLDDD